MIPSPQPLFFQHASTLGLRGVAVLFTGDSGAGKTTIARIALQAGRRVFGDEIAVCRGETDGRWTLVAAGTSDPGGLLCTDAPRNTRIGLIVHVSRHLEQGFALHACSPRESVVLGFRSMIQAGQHDPSVRARRFHTFCAFARAIPSVILDFSPDDGFLSALEERIPEEGCEHGC